ncbi:LON peptidase substrate-binding domain-containing protein [Yinghuangia sp. ASG 101]|uniref:LON peptidase substrate-binding domain-containing protein n=1 Tax=Yinghuangia sp. ASG 101 TaxID=2896848 RepID=UPI001E33002F|nr:LON peptidase substrate-binding domain-containing protein [Yinghuangia sp. ASG 101]UGQ10081.1 LON peptidase substrate-binding domain-containing protein [Yinghuangia sp. ASG 101]
MTDRLPLFPLNSVLYPGLVLPLNVFEERYRRLVRDLLALPDRERRFGVIALRSGREVGALPVDPAEALFPLGCTAEVATMRPHADGRYDIVATGATRFRLLSVDDTGPYLVGEVEFLEEPAGDDAEVLALAVTRAFTDYQRELVEAQGRGPVELPELPDDPVVLSYLVAAAMVLDLTDKQKLLSLDDATVRLRGELGLLRRETALLGHIRALPAVELLRQKAGPN